MATSKKATATKTATTIAPVTEVTTTKVETVNLGTCTYHLWRHWTKNVLREAGVISAKFVKEEKSYNGTVTVARADKDKAKKAILDYQKKEQCIDLITF